MSLDSLSAEDRARAEEILERLANLLLDKWLEERTMEITNKQHGKYECR